jgi:hypothetical protein
MKLEISRQIFQNPQISDLMKNSYAGPEMFHAGGRADRQTDRQTDRQKDGQTDGRTDRQDDGRTDDRQT